MCALIPSFIFREFGRGRSVFCRRLGLPCGTKRQKYPVLSLIRRDSYKLGIPVYRRPARNKNHPNGVFFILLRWSDEKPRSGVRLRVGEINEVQSSRQECRAGTIGAERIPPHPPVISISSNLYEIDIKNPRVPRGFCYFTDSDKPAIAAKSATFLGYLYPAQFCIVSEFNRTPCLYQSDLVRIQHGAFACLDLCHYRRLVLKCG